MSTRQNQGFGQWRERLLPIYSYELKKFFPMVIIMFWVLFILTTVRNIKDSLIVTAPNSSADTLVWLKTCYVTPLSILYVIFYAKLSNKLSLKGLYYACLIPFGIFFFIFGFLIYPNYEILQASPETIQAWQTSFPGLKDFFPTVGYWAFSLFYIMSEMWGGVAVALLFWQFANQVTSSIEAKRFYPVFSLWSNTGLILAGVMTKYSSRFLKEVILPSGERDFSSQMYLYMGFVALGCLIIGICYWWMNAYVLTNPLYYDEAKLLKKGKQPKPKLSLGESVRYLFTSRYVMYIAILVLACNITITIIEIVWKGQVKILYPDKGAFSAFMGDYFIYLGAATMFLILFSQNILRVFGWTVSAAITPWVLLLSGSLFFLFIIFTGATESIAGWLGVAPAVITVTIGSFQNAFTKASKHSLFDPTKEMVYIPADEEIKVKGKAAVDVIGGRMGKGGGGFIQIIFKSLYNSIHMTALYIPTLGFVVVGICMAWAWAVKKLSVDYHEKLEEHEKELASEKK